MSLNILIGCSLQSSHLCSTLITNSIIYNEKNIWIPKKMHLEEILNNKDHRRTLCLPSPEFDKYKAVAAIHLEKYDDALTFASKNSFEQAYIYYRLKNYKKSLKILRKLEGREIEILKAQCLYFLGHFHDAYIILKRQGSTDEFAVNLMAIASMNDLSAKDRVAPSIFTVTEEELIDEDNFKPKFTDSECHVESEFNRVYKYLENQEEYLSILKKMTEIHTEDNEVFKKQIANLTLNCAEKFGSYHFSKREREVANFNMGRIDTISNPIFFQDNFLPNSTKSTDYKIFKDFQNNKEDYYKGLKSFEPTSDRLRILKAFIVAKRKTTEERKKTITKTISGCKSSLSKKILDLFCADVSEEKFKNEALKILMKKH